MTVSGHLKATVSFLLVVSNLLLWMTPLLLLLVIRILVPGSRPNVSRIGCSIYRQAVAFDDWVLKRISGARWRDPNLELDREQAVVVVANHRSWTDVLLLQSVIARRGPIVKFLCKRELAYIPILGLICIVFDFPVLRRKAHALQSEQDRREDDRRRVREACEVVHRAPAAMLSFAEGTRFSTEKQQSTKSPYHHLLPPRPAGFAAILDALESLKPNVVDVTIRYPHPSTFWQFLGGSAGEIEIETRTFPIEEVLERGARTWLEDRWVQKDKMLDIS